MSPTEKTRGSDPSEGPANPRKDQEENQLPDYTTATSSSAAFQSRFASVSMHMEDRLRFLNFPQVVVNRCRTTILTVWIKGIQEERMYGDSYEIKVHGNPWRRSAGSEEAVGARRLIRAMFSTLHASGWVLMLSTDISRKRREKDTLMFRYQDPAPAECDWCCIGFARNDRIKFIDVLPEVYSSFIHRLGTIWQVQDHYQHSEGVYEVELCGTPWLAQGTDTMQVRKLLLLLLEDLEAEGWSPYASIDQKSDIGDFTETDTWHCCKLKGWTKGAPVYHN